MSVCSLGFLFFTGVVTLLFHARPGLGGRRMVLGAASLFFLAAFRPDLRSLAALAAFLFVTHMSLRLAPRASRLTVVLLGAAVVAAFLVLRRYSFLQSLLPAKLLGHPLELVGLSYMLFRFLHLLVDVRQGQIGAVSLTSYLSYQLSFLTLVAGPIQRYRDFRASWDTLARSTPPPRDTLLAWDRLLSGMIKIGLLSTALLYVYERAAAGALREQPPPALLLRFMAYFYSYPAYLFFNFSGYTDIVVGAGRLLNFSLPENFDRPYLARNILDFWNRWHITLTKWIRDYIFMTSYKWSVDRLGPSPFLGPSAVFVALLIAGLWHGSTSNFALFGLVHGVGAAVNQVYDEILKRRLKAPARRAYAENAWIRGAATFATLHVVCFSFLFFPGDLDLVFARLHFAATAVARLAGSAG